MQRSQVKTSISPANAGGRIGQPALTELLAHIFAQPLTLLGQADATVSTYAIFWCIGHAHPETIGLYALVSGAFFAGPICVNARQQSAGGIAGHHVGIDFGCELMVPCVLDLYPIERFAICGI